MYLKSVGVSKSVIENAPELVRDTHASNSGLLYSVAICRFSIRFQLMKP